MRTYLRRWPTCLKVSETVHEQRDRASQTHLTNGQDHLSEVTLLGRATGATPSVLADVRLGRKALLTHMRKRRGAWHRALEPSDRTLSAVDRPPVKPPPPVASCRSV